VISLSSATYASTLATNYAAVLRGLVDQPLLHSLPDLTKVYEAALERTEVPAPALIKEYGSLIGSLIYPVPCSCPDFAAAVSLLARMLTFPTVDALAAAHRCLNYFVRTLHRGITFDGTAALRSRLTSTPTGTCPTRQLDLLYCSPVLPYLTPASASNASHCRRLRPR
jgi:hypothetical protein